MLEVVGRRDASFGQIWCKIELNKILAIESLPHEPSIFTSVFGTKKFLDKKYVMLLRDTGDERRNNIPTRRILILSQSCLYPPHS